MSPIIAITIFLTFIFIGFRMEHRSSGKVTNAVWFPFFWLVICASRSVGQWVSIFRSNNRMLSETEVLEGNLAGSLIDQVVLSVVIIIGLIIIYKRKESAVAILKSNVALLMFIIYLGLTTIWSDIPDVSFRRWIKFTGNFIMAAVLVTEPDPSAAVQSTFRRATYFLFPISVMFIKYFPSLGVIYSRYGDRIETGAALMKNSLGHLSFVFLFFISWQLLYNWNNKYKTNLFMLLYDAIIIIMGAWLFNAAHSAGSIGSLIIGMIILISSKIPIVAKNIKTISVFAIVVICLILLLQSSLGIIEYIVTSLGKNMTFTDRVPLWNTLIELGLKQPILGYGYGGFFTPERIKLCDDFSQGHNGYLEIFVEGGLIAFIFVGILLISVLKKIYKGMAHDFKIAIFLLSFFIMILLANITESCFARERDLLTIVFFIIALYDFNLAKKRYPYSRTRLQST